jgi:hypothetical protein
MRNSSDSVDQPVEVQPFNLDLLKNQQSMLRHHGRLHWAHWLIISLSLVS